MLRGRCAIAARGSPFVILPSNSSPRCCFSPSGKLSRGRSRLLYWVFISLLIVGTFVDLEHFIIPDQITIGGTIAGICASVAVPALMNTDSRVAAGDSLAPRCGARVT